MKFFVKPMAVLTAVLMLFIFFGEEVRAQGRTLKLGYLDALTGPMAVYGIPQKEGIMMAVEEINEAGGLAIGNEKIKIELLISDHGTKSAEAVSIVEKYIERDKVKIIFGEILSSSAMAWAPVVERYKGKVMGFCTGPSSSAISRLHPHIYNSKWVIETSFKGGAFLAKYLKLKKMYLMIEADDYSIMLAKGTREEFEKNGGKVVKEGHFNLHDTDFYTQLSSIKGMDIDCIYVAGLQTPTQFIFKQAKELGIKAVLAASIGAGEKDTLSRFKCADMEGVYDVGTPIDALLQSGREITVRIANKYKQKYGKDMAVLALAGYGGVYMLAKGLEKAGTIDDIEKIMKGLSALTVKEMDHLLPFAQLPAPGTDKLFNKDRQTMTENLVGKWENCRIKFVTSVQRLQ